MTSAANFGQHRPADADPAARRDMVESRGVEPLHPAHNHASGSVQLYLAGMSAGTVHCRPPARTEWGLGERELLEGYRRRDGLAQEIRSAVAGRPHVRCEPPHEERQAMGRTARVVLPADEIGSVLVLALLTAIGLAVCLLAGTP